MSTGIWVPGAPGPSIEDFVARLEKHIARFAAERAGGEAAVDVELADGAVIRLASIAPEPGYGFVTLVPHTEGAEPEELVVPVGSIVRLRLTRPEDHPPFGFSAPGLREE